MEWQPTKSAPRDGTRILAFVPHIGEIIIVQWGFAEPGGEERQWTTDSEGPGYSSGFEDNEIAAWMPLPQPPPM